MVYDYIITLKKSDYSSIDRITQLMLLFAILIFAYFYYTHPQTGVAYIFFAVGIFLAAGFSFYKKRQTGFAYFRFALLLAAAGWFLGADRNIWMGILYGIAGLLERQVKFPAEIGFSEDEIAFNTFPKRKMQWHEFSNVVIKDGLITIDQKNNKLVQKEIDSHVSPTIEKEFNDFCKKQLEKNNAVNA